ncbi:MAG: endonuclease MutS2 [Christensenellaceae bacterium]|nr:endonuclease MutS2 [Christensenellaceae bacterium]
MISEKVLKTLEYDKILKKLQTHCGCCVSRELADELRPLTELDDVYSELRLTSEAESFFLKTGYSPVDDFPDMRSALKRMNAALFLSCEELLNIGKCLKAVRIAREQLTPLTAKDDDDTPCGIANLASGLIAHKYLEEEIQRCILNEDELFDGASPALARIRRNMRIANERVREKLNSIIRSSTYSKYLQDPLITIRNGRFVVPVKQEYRANIPGLIHDQSGSGQTLFVEPTDVVELGNEYKKLVIEEQAEVERILTELTAMIKPSANDIYTDLFTLGRIDLCFAKAKLAKEMRAVMPKLNGSGVLRIVKGRHPLIASHSVVPIDIWLGSDFTTLIVTGSNTGGKTVTLKTTGLFTLMAQSGMFIPANVGTEISVFESIFADIGDEQSIEQSLSTFSSHMRNIVGILENADEKSLVLLDELGAGTDPIEGAALAMSILEDLHMRGSFTVATTHYSEIKAFALTHAGMENASMEFDVDKLCPTYRLFIGIPGKSNAFEISRRLGISEYIINNARAFIKKEDTDFEAILSDAEMKKRRAEEEMELAEQARQEHDRLTRELREEREKLEREKSELRLKAREDARKIVADAKREMEQIIVQLRSIKDIDRRAMDRIVQQQRDELRKAEGELAEDLPMLRTGDGKPPKMVLPGQTVKVLSLDKTATVLKKPDKNGEVQVQVGIIKLSVRLDDIRIAAEAEQAKSNVKVEYNPADTVGLELDIRGMLVDDAKPIVDKYLYSANQQGLTEVNIIHGKGTGALRAGIQEYLKRHPRCKSFRNGNYGEGDFGVTVVTLR